MAKNSNKELRAITNNKEIKEIKKLRFQLKIINFISRLTNENNFKIQELKNKNFNSILLFIDKYKKNELPSRINLLTSYLLNEKKVINKYDERGNLIHYKDYKNTEYWKQYDEKGNLIHYKDSRNIEYWMDYDEKENIIHYKDCDEECWRGYDDKRNIIYYKNSRNFEYWKQYDEKGNLINYNCYDMYGLEADYIMMSKSFAEKISKPLVKNCILKPSYMLSHWHY